MEKLQELLNLLKETHLKTLQYYDLSDDQLLKTYAPGKWTIRQILVHLADAEAVLLDRIKRVIAEPKQVIWAFDQDLWSQNLQYDNYPLQLSKAVYDANRNTVIYLAQKFYISSGSKPFVHSETGVRTLKDEFVKIGSHNKGHLDQIQIAIEKG